MNLSNLFTAEVLQIIRLLALIGSLLHLLIAFILFRQIVTATAQVYTGSSWLRVISALHLILLAAILIFVILY